MTPIEMITILSIIPALLLTLLYFGFILMMEKLSSVNKEYRVIGNKLIEVESRN